MNIAVATQRPLGAYLVEALEAAGAVLVEWDGTLAPDQMATLITDGAGPALRVRTKEREFAAFGLEASRVVVFAVGEWRAHHLEYADDTICAETAADRLSAWLSEVPV